MLPRFLLTSLAALCLAALAGLGGHLWRLQAEGNFHTVVPGALYRSAQPDPARLAQAAQDLHLRAVLNLRGAAPGADWYEAERRAAVALGLRLIDFAMSDHEILSPARRADLVRLMAGAPKPLLLHCKAGADRTGLASALYLARLAHRPLEEAEGQLSLAYGHIALPVMSRAWPMDQTWGQIEAATGAGSGA